MCQVEGVRYLRVLHTWKEQQLGILAFAYSVHRKNEYRAAVALLLGIDLETRPPSSKSFVAEVRRGIYMTRNTDGARKQGVYRGSAKSHRRDGTRYHQWPQCGRRQSRAGRGIRLFQS